MPDGQLFNDDVEIGTIVGPDGSYLFPVDTFTPSPFADLFVQTNDVNAPSDAAVDQLSDWTVTVNREAVSLVNLFRKTKIAGSARIDGFRDEFLQEHVIHLDVGRTLVDGDVLSVVAPGGLLVETVTIDTTTTRSDAVHVNQVGFAPRDSAKIAVLSTWLSVDTERPESEQLFQNGVEYLVRACELTADERVLIDAVNDANFALGMNPDNVSFVSGVGDEQVRELLIGDAEALGGELSPSIVAYGNYDFFGNARPENGISIDEV